MPFDAILEKRNSADKDAGREISDGVQPAEEGLTESATIPVNPLRVPRGADVQGVRGRLNLDGDVTHAFADFAKDEADAAKDKEDLANSVALLLTPFAIPQQPQLTDTRPTADGASFSTTNHPDQAEVERQLLQALLSRTADTQDPATDAQADSRLAKIMDAWTKTAAASAEADIAADPSSSRPAQSPPTTVAAFVDAIRLSTNSGSSADRDAGSNQQAMTLAFDRSNGKVARALNLVQPIATFETTLGGARAEAATAITLPNEANVASSIVQSMRLQMRDGVGTAVVHLEPDYLGAVSIALRVEGGVVTATLHAENHQVRAWIEANEPILRQGLLDQGLSLARLLVSDERVAEDRSGRRPQSEQEPPARHKPRRAESGTFEVVV
jgi:Flagellar hook-length control protein FliK